MTGITYGTFDFCHIGHINLLKSIREHCDYVIVGLSTESFNEAKGKKSFYEFDKRRDMLIATGLVDLVIPENDWDQKINDIQKYNVDVFFMGSDWNEKFDFLKRYCTVIYLPRTLGISSTQIRNSLGGDIYAL